MLHHTPQLWIKILFLVIAILLVSSLGRTLWHSYKTQQWIQNQEQQVHILEQEVETLEETVREATSSFTLEKRVRDELDLQKPDEQIFQLNQ